MTTQQAQGVTGAVGPNDAGYAVLSGRNAAEQIRKAIGFYFVGYYGGGDRPSATHPLAAALQKLAEFDEANCWSANLKHDPRLFDRRPL